MKAALPWFRNGLTLQDNPALTAPLASGAKILPVLNWGKPTHILLYHWLKEGRGHWPLMQD